MKEKDTVDEDEGTSSSTLSEERRIAMSNQVKGMTLSSFINYMDFQNVSEEQELGTGKNWCGTVGFDQVDPPYSVRKDRKDDHVD